MEITSEELKQKFDSGEPFVLIDVREPEEYDICRLKDAKLIPIQELPKRIQELDPKNPLVLYCHYGTRSMQAALWLSQQGFREVSSLQGGIDAWAELIDPSIERY